VSLSACVVAEGVGVGALITVSLTASPIISVRGERERERERGARERGGEREGERITT